MLLRRVNMSIYVSRYSNPELRTGKYTAIRISLGTPKWDIGYRLDGEMKNLMPFGLLGNFEKYEDFKPEYFKRLDRIGFSTIKRELDRYQSYGKDVVLLCYEDVRKPDDWCHRTAFSEWWETKTGERIPELFDPTTPKLPPQKKKDISSTATLTAPTDDFEEPEQLRLF